MLELTITSPYLTVNSVINYPKGKGWSGDDLSYWLSTFVFVCYFPKQQIGKGKVLRWGREGGELTLCLSINILWSIGNPMPELTFTPRCSWL
jgi:hypothetical protein